MYKIYVVTNDKKLYITIEKLTVDSLLWVSICDLLLSTWFLQELSIEN